MSLLRLTHILASTLACATALLLVGTNFAPLAWGCAAFCIWLLFALSKGWENLQTIDKNLLAWGWLSVAAFNCFIRSDPSFKVRAHEKLQVHYKYCTDSA